jgi:hypothetical protein
LGPSLEASVSNDDFEGCAYLTWRRACAGPRRSRARLPGKAPQSGDAGRTYRRVATLGLVFGLSAYRKPSVKVTVDEQTYVMQGAA